MFEPVGAVMLNGRTSQRHAAPDATWRRSTARISERLLRWNCAGHTIAMSLLPSEGGPAGHGKAGVLCAGAT